MKVYQTLAVAIFTFMAAQCQAASTIRSPIKTKSTMFGLGSTCTKIDYKQFNAMQVFDFNSVCDSGEKNLFLNNLFDRDDKNIVFTYNLLTEIDKTGETGKNKTRAATLLAAIRKDSALMASLQAKPDAVITLNRKINTLGTSKQITKGTKIDLTLTPAEIGLINQQLAAAPLAINTGGFGSPNSADLGNGTWKSVPTASPRPGPFSPAVVAIDFAGVWNSAKASKGAVYNRDFYHDYFLKAARELYKTDRQVFSVAGGTKNWLNMTLTPVIVDALFGSGTMQNDFPWLNEKDPTLQVIGYLSWLKDSGLEDDFVQRAVADLKNILKGGDVVGTGHPSPEQVRSTGSAAIKFADWTATKQTFTSAQDVLSHFTSEYGVGAANLTNKQHRFTLAFISSLAYMNQDNALLKPTSCIDLRTAAGADLQAYISEHFCASVDGKRLAR
jgi:ethanolamine utilization protein EutP (predicted NTPase)